MVREYGEITASAAIRAARVWRQGDFIIPTGWSFQNSPLDVRHDAGGESQSVAREDWPRLRAPPGGMEEKRYRRLGERENFDKRKQVLASGTKQIRIDVFS